MKCGYLPVDKTGANLLFQLLAKRYEKYSTIVTSNQQFSKWGEVLSDATLASAILDRLLHHSYVFNITGNSYRIKDKAFSIIFARRGFARLLRNVYIRNCI